jgi:hypothetical protein
MIVNLPSEVNVASITAPFMIACRISSNPLWLTSATGIVICPEGSAAVSAHPYWPDTTSITISDVDTFKRIHTNLVNSV